MTTVGGEERNEDWERQGGEERNEDWGRGGERLCGEAGRGREE
jgi:hypothetical protein